MQRFRSLRNFLFKCRYGFRGAPIFMAGQNFRLDESLRRWGVQDEEAFHREIRARVRPGDVVIDIGANFGMHTLVAAEQVGDVGRVYAFEPIPANLKLLRRNLKLNKLDDRVVVEAAAVSNALDETLTMQVPEGEEVIVTASLGKQSPCGREIRVRSVRLDDYASARDLKPTLIKIDVEGAEVEVLKGGRELLRRHRPILLIEVHTFAFRDFGTSQKEFSEILSGLNYEESILGRPGGEDFEHYLALYVPVS